MSQTLSHKVDRDDIVDELSATAAEGDDPAARADDVLEAQGADGVAPGELNKRAERLQDSKPDADLQGGIDAAQTSVASNLGTGEEDLAGR